MDHRRGVVIVAPAGSSLGVALLAALTTRGWESTLVAEFPGALTAVGNAVLLVVEDDQGRVGLVLPPQAALRGVVALGSVESLPWLIPLARRGVRVMNQATPIVVLVRLLEAALADDRGASPPGADVDSLRRRVAESVSLSRLTEAEADALRGLVDGLSALQIAQRSHRSLHTVRSHIKAVLAKLGVNSQVAAVAIAHRSAPASWPDSWRAQITTFRDEERSPPAPS